MSRRNIAVSVAVAVVASVVLVGSRGGSSGTAQAAGNGQIATATAKVVRTDLAVTEQVSGSIGYDGSSTIVNPGGGSAQSVTAAQQAVSQAQAALNADQVAAGDTAASSNQAMAAAQSALTAAQSALTADTATQSRDCATAAPSCTSDGAKVAQDEAQVAQQQQAQATAALNATRSAHQDQAKLAADNSALGNAQSALAGVLRVAANPGTTYTALPAPGQVVTQGQALYAIDGKAVPLFYGPTVMWQDFRAGMDDGADVGELTANLLALGFGAPAGLSASNHFSSATEDAVRRWQTSLGLPATGVIRMGELQFAPGAVRVSAVHAALGGAVTPGPVLDATTTTRIVTIALAVDKEYLVHAGDAVGVILPDGKTTTTGHVRDVSTVATAPSSGSGGSGGGGTPTVTVTVVLDHPSETGNLDQAPVSVTITDQAVQGVLAVPINALVALAEGGDAVDVVDPGGARHLVAVTAGLFSNTMVQVSGNGIAEGTVVEVPSS
jgi:Putative peptidoglycan binding domain